MDRKIPELSKGDIKRLADLVNFNRGSQKFRNAVSLGGDSDTLAAITGGIAEAEYGIPEEIRTQALDKLDQELNSLCEQGQSAYRNDSLRREKQYLPRRLR